VASTLTALPRQCHEWFSAGRGKKTPPIDEADRIDDWLYLPETLYAFVLIIVVSAGAPGLTASMP
jgi:hypothetical protein